VRAFLDAHEPKVIAHRARYTSSVAVTRTWSEGRDEPPPVLGTRMPMTRWRGRGATQCDRAGGLCPPFSNRASGSSTRCRAWRLRDQHAHGIDPAAVLLRRPRASGIDRRVRHHPQHLFVAPDVVLERRDVEIRRAESCGSSRDSAARGRSHLVEKASLCANLGLTADRDVAARRHVEVISVIGSRSPRALASTAENVPAVGLAAKDWMLKLSNGRRESTTTP